MAMSRGFFLLAVLLAVSFVGVAMATPSTKEVSGTGSSAQLTAKEDSSDTLALEVDVEAQQNSARTMRAANAAPETKQIPSQAGPQEEPQFEQQILVVKGNPSQEKLNEEIRKALRALLGTEQGDQVQIRQLKDVDELRRVVPGAGPGPIGLKVVP